MARNYRSDVGLENPSNILQGGVDLFPLLMIHEHNILQLVDQSLGYQYTLQIQSSPIVSNVVPCSSLQHWMVGEETRKFLQIIADEDPSYIGLACFSVSYGFFNNLYNFKEYIYTCTLREVQSKSGEEH